MLKLKLQYFGHLMWRVDSLEKTLMLGGIGGRRRRGRQRMRWLDWLDGRESEWIPEVGDGQGGLACCDSWGRKELDTIEQLNWTELTDAEAETPILWPPNEKNWLTGKDPNARKDWRQGKGIDRGWYGWMASLTRWTWVWVNSRSWWWTGRPGMLRFMGLPRVGHDLVTELYWSTFYFGKHKFVFYVCDPVSVLYISSFVSYFILHI